MSYPKNRIACLELALTAAMEAQFWIDRAVEGDQLDTLGLLATAIVEAAAAARDGELADLRRRNAPSLPAAPPPPCPSKSPAGTIACVLPAGHELSPGGPLRHEGPPNGSGVPIMRWTLGAESTPAPAEIPPAPPPAAKRKGVRRG